MVKEDIARIKATNSLKQKIAELPEMLTKCSNQMEKEDIARIKATNSLKLKTVELPEM